MVGKAVSLQELVITFVKELHLPPITFREMFCLKKLNSVVELWNYYNLSRTFIALVFLHRTGKSSSSVKKPLIIECYNVSFEHLQRYLKHILVKSSLSFD